MNETGKGRLLLDRSKWHDDIRLLQVARKRRWEIDDSFRDLIVSRLRTVIEEGDDEIALKAIAESRHMEAQNQRDEHKALDEFQNRVIELADRFGIDISAARIGEQASGGAGDGDADIVDADED
jgi:hypothetical protein